MKATQELTVVLPEDLAKDVAMKVRSGAFASASDLVRESIQSLFDRDLAIDAWLRDEVVEGHREFMSDPSKGVDADALLARLRRDE